MSKNNLKAIRGMNDIVPEHIAYWHHVEKILRCVAESYGYQEIRFPIVEHTELFQRTIGTATDIVAKEMYTFLDRNDDSLTLRPEGTASCVRAGIEQGLLYNQIRRLWYLGPMFRHERPQKGRYRQFHQFGIEAFGLLGPDIDAEHILMTARFWEKLNIADQLVLHINSLGDNKVRQVYHEKLVTYFKKHYQELDEDSKERLNVNPLRILDSKNPKLEAIIQEAPKLLDYLDGASKEHFTELLHILDTNKIAYQVDPKLVRGLDYYCLTAFEWQTEYLGAQGTVCGGGRYNTLVEQLGGKPTPAVGFALGLERLIELVSKKVTLEHHPDIYLIMVGAKAIMQGIEVAEELRDKMPEVKLLVNCGGGSFKTQFKRADKSGAKIALILGDEELAKGVVGIKYLREEREQENISLTKLKDYLQY